MGEGVLVDTSAWVDALRRDGDVNIRAAVSRATMDGAAVMCDMVLLELWNGARGVDERRLLQDLEQELSHVATTPAVWARARELATTCREQGVTVPATDLLVAACVDVHGLALLHHDRHLELIERLRR